MVMTNMTCKVILIMSCPNCLPSDSSLSRLLDCVAQAIDDLLLFLSPACGWICTISDDTRSKDQLPSTHTRTDVYLNEKADEWELIDFD